jgi:hypothetical protein
MPLPDFAYLTPTTLTTAYTANTVVGGLQTISNVPERSMIRDIMLNIDGNISPALDLYFFRGLPSTIADNNAFAPTFADQTMFLPGDKISVVAGDWVVLNNKTRAHKPSVNKDFVSAVQGVGNYALYLYIVCTGTPTFPAAKSLQLTISFWK